MHEEEEVPRSGSRVTQSFQRTRWYGGEVFVWLGVRKQTGRARCPDRDVVNDSAP